MLKEKTEVHSGSNKHQFHTSSYKGLKINKMTAKAKIKVIKKDAIKSVEVPVLVEQRVKQAAAREMVSTVTNWVSDFQQKRRDETRQAFEILFQSTAQTSQM